jgi:hypothetical protein
MLVMLNLASLGTHSTDITRVMDLYVLPRSLLLWLHSGKDFVILTSASCIYV